MGTIEESRAKMGQLHFYKIFKGTVKAASFLHLIGKGNINISHIESKQSKGAASFLHQMMEHLFDTVNANIILPQLFYTNRNIRSLQPQSMLIIFRYFELLLFYFICRLNSDTVQN